MKGREGLLRRIDAQLFAEVPATRLAAVRIVVGLYVLVYTLVQAPTLWKMAAFDAQRFVPVGLLASLGAPPPLWLVRVLVLVLVCGALAFMVGFRFRIAAPALALGLLLATTFHNSWGHMGHGDNLMVLHVAILAVSPAADAWSTDAPSRRAPGEPVNYAWPLVWMMWVAALTYFVAGVAKLNIGGWHWIDGTVLGDQVAGDALRKIRLGAIASPFSGWLAKHPAVHAPLTVGTSVVELGAPLALLTIFSGRLRKAWVAAVWSMHLGILALMSIGFVYPLSGVAFVCFFEVEGPMSRMLARWTGTRERPAVAGQNS